MSRAAQINAEVNRLLIEIQKRDKRIAELEKLLADCDPQWQHAVSENMRLKAENERLLVLATKWCDPDHHDWQEILKFGGEDLMQDKIDRPDAAMDTTMEGGVMWIDVRDQLPDPSCDEIEIAYWDGCLMNRIFGTYFEDGSWFSSDWQIDSDFKVTHWRNPVELPAPPVDDSTMNDTTEETK